MSESPMTATDVAKALGVHKATIHRWVESGRLTPSVEVPGYNGARLFEPAAIAALQREKAS